MRQASEASQPLPSGAVSSNCSLVRALLKFVKFLNRPTLEFLQRAIKATIDLAKLLHRERCRRVTGVVSDHVWKMEEIVGLLNETGRDV